MILEDGTGVADANAYASIEAVNAYLEARGRLEENGWDDKDDDEKAACIVAATDYVEQQYSSRFVGRKSTNAQGLSWPRYDAYDQDGFILIGVPKAIIHATAEYAAHVSLGALSTDLAAASRTIKREKKKVGSLEKEVEYITEASDSSFTAVSQSSADKLISSLVKTRNYGMQRA